MRASLVALAVALGSFAAAQECTRYQYTDTFADGKLDPNHWFLAAGKASLVTPSAGGGIDISLEQASTNQVVMSTLRFGPGSTFKVVAKGSAAVGVISTFCLYDAAGGKDEIDVEFVANARNVLMVPAWVKAARLQLINPPTNNDWSSYADPVGGATFTLASDWAPGGAYTINKAGFDFAADFHTYEVKWTADKISLTFDGAEIMSYTKGSNGKFPSDSLPFNMGIWTDAVSPDFASWAGKIDFAKDPRPTWSVKSVEIDGCGIPNEHAPAGAAPRPVGAPPAPSSSATTVTISSSAGGSVTTSVVETPVATLSTVADATSTIAPPLVAQPTQPAGGASQADTTTPPIELNQGFATASIVGNATVVVPVQGGGGQPVPDEIVTIIASDDGTGAGAAPVESEAWTSGTPVGADARPTKVLTPIDGAAAPGARASVAGLALAAALAFAV